MTFDLQHRRVLRTFVGLVLGAGLTSVLADPALSFSSQGHWEVVVPQFSAATFTASLNTASFAIMVVIPLGLIVHAIFYARNWRTPTPYLAASALAGVGLGFGLGAQVMTLPAWLLCITCGVMCGVILWLIRRPDRDVATVCAVPAP